MKIILLSDVPKVGRKHEVKEVSSGYATNFLIPRRLAEIATNKKVAALEKQKVADTERAEVRSKLLHDELQKIAGKTIHIQAKANEQGHLFQGIHTKEIVEAIKKELGVELPEESIQLAEPVKEIGEHELTVSVNGENTTLSLSIKGGE